MEFIERVPALFTQLMFAGPVGCMLTASVLEELLTSAPPVMFRENIL